MSHKTKYPGLISIKHFSLHLWLLAIVIWYIASVTPGFSQVTLEGTIKDKSSGKPLSEANIVIERTFLSTISDLHGKYEIHSMKSGEYNLRISFMGFKTIQQKLVIHQDTTVDFLLEPSLILGEEVNIFATRAQRGTPTTFTTLTNKEINAINNGQDLPYILQAVPSVIVTSDAGNGIGYTGMSIRGTDLTRINVTMDGIPLNDAETQGVWFVDLPDLASSTQNIQVQRGVGTSSNGAGAFGATINIQTLSTESNPIAELNSSAGSYGALKTTFLFGTGMIKNKFAFSGRASYITSDGYIDRASAKLKSFYLSGGYFGKTTTVKVNLISGWEKTYQAWQGVPKDSLTTNRRYNPSGEYFDQNGQVAYYQNQTDNYNQNHYQLLISQKAGRNIDVNAALFYTHGIGYYENYEQDQPLINYGLNDIILGNDTIRSSDMITQKWLDNDFYGLTFSGNYNSGEKLKITFGGALSNYHGKHFGKIIWAQFAANGNNQRNWYDNTGEKSDLNIYLKINYQLIKKCNLFADLQYRNVDYTITGDLESLSPLNQVHHFNFVNPKAGISFDLNSSQHLYFSFSIGNREPNRNNYEVADSSYMPSPERLYDYEFGYDLRLSDFSTGACLYFMNYHDQLVLTGKINSVGEAIMTNVPHSYRTGIEIFAAANVFKWLKWQITSTFSLNKIRNFTEYIDKYDSLWNLTGQVMNSLGTTDISFSPGIIASNTFTFLPFKNMNIAINSKYIGRQFIDNTSDKSRSLDPCFVNRLSIGYSINTKVFRDVGLNLTINNLFGSKYETNAWVYRYYYNGQPGESNGYFPQALINFLFGISIKV